jgi:hypothetical protein
MIKKSESLGDNPWLVLATGIIITIVAALFVESNSPFRFIVYIVGGIQCVVILIIIAAAYSIRLPILIADKIKSKALGLLLLVTPILILWKTGIISLNGFIFLTIIPLVLLISSWDSKDSSK